MSGVDDKGETLPTSLGACVEQVRGDLAPGLALVLFWTWFFTTVQGPIRFPLEDICPIPVPSWCVTVLFVPVGIALVRRLDATGMRAGLALGAASACMSLGVAVSTLWLYAFEDGLLGDALYALGSVLMGTGAGALLLYLCRYYFKAGVPVIISHGIFTLLCSSLLELVFILPGVNVIVPLFSIVSPFGIWLCLNGRRDVFVRSEGGEGEPPHPDPVFSKAKFPLTMVAQGLSFGLGLGLLAFWGDMFLAPRMVAVLCGVLAAVILFLTAVRFKANFTYMTYLVGLPFVAVGLLTIACSERLLEVGNTLQGVGSCYLYMLDLALFIYLAKVSGGDIDTVCLHGTAFLFGSQVFGGCLGSVLALQMRSQESFFILVGILSAFVLLCALYISNTGTVEVGWGGARPGAMTSEWLDARVEGISCEYGLTPREREVMFLAARGLSRQDVAGELCISDETVKTHFRNVYQKVGVHSQTELIALVWDSNVRE